MSKLAIFGVVTVVVLGGAFAWMKFGSTRSVSPPVASPTPPGASPKPPTAVSTVPPSGPTPVATSSSTPSETLNAIAHAPKNAIDKAQDVVAGQRAKEQARIDAMAAGEETPKKTPPPPAATVPPAGPSAKSATTVRALAPGVSTTTEVGNSAGASTAFSSFVANAKIGGVAEGAAPKVFINGRLARIGETVDATQGIVFERLEPEKRLLVFKDKTGAIVTRRY
ncbi:MAG: hypothetical protein ABIZ49_02745 [Opitutaceae bacterium]